MESNGRPLQIRKAASFCQKENYPPLNKILGDFVDKWQKGKYSCSLYRLGKLPLMGSTNAGSGGRKDPGPLRNEFRERIHIFIIGSNVLLTKKAAFPSADFSNFRAGTKHAKWSKKEDLLKYPLPPLSLGVFPPHPFLSSFSRAFCPLSFRLTLFPLLLLPPGVFPKQLFRL